MRITPREHEKLMIVVAGDLARRRRERGLKLNHPEAIAFITAELIEGARDGRTVADLMSYGATILTEDDVMEGVADMIPSIQVEVTFPDGTKLIPVNQPIRAPIEVAVQTLGSSTSENAAMPRPGEFVLNDEPITINEGRETVTLMVKNTGDRPIQIGSHYHFAEANPGLQFDRDKAVGFRLDIPSGTSARFEPGDARKVQLVAYGGKREVYGFRSEWDGPVGNAAK